MPIDAKLAPWQVLGVAIRSEIDAAAFYTKLQERIKNAILLQKLKFLAMEEEHHRAIIERLADQRFRGKPTDPPPASLMPPITASLGPDPSVTELFQAALAAEVTAERFYEEAAAKSEDEMSRHMLTYLSRIERSHQAVIKAEVDLLEKFPDYYNVEDFYVGADLFHVGP
jgi:rubrerythrin